jgi:hypothetical protein
MKMAAMAPDRFPLTKQDFDSAESQKHGSRKYVEDPLSSRHSDHTWR